MLLTLVEVKTRFLPGLQIEPIIQPIDLDPARFPRLPASRVHRTLEAFQPADVSVVAENNVFRAGHFGQQIADDPAALVHRQRLNLNHEGVPELIHDHARQIIRLGPNQSLE